MDPGIAVLGEALLAVVGLDNVLSGEPIKITQAMRHDAGQLPGKLRKAMRAFLGGPDSFARFRLPEPISYKAALSRLLTPPTDEQRIEQLATVESGDEQLALHMAAERALVILRPFVPVYYRETATGPKPETPPDTSVARLRRALTLVNDPARVLENMEAGTLLREEREVMAGVYPLLYQDIVESVPLSLSALVAEKASYELPWRRDRLLRIFLGAETITPELAARLHLSFQQDKAAHQQGAPRTAAPNLAEQTETQATRVATK